MSTHHFQVYSVEWGGQTVSTSLPVYSVEGGGQTVSTSLPSLQCRVGRSDCVHITSVYSVSGEVRLCPHHFPVYSESGEVRLCPHHFQVYSVEWGGQTVSTSLPSLQCRVGRSDCVHITSKSTV